MLASIWHLTPDAWTSLATWTGVLVATAAATAAVVVGRRQLDEAQRLRNEQAQPYVVVFADDSGGDPRHIDLVIKNFGQTAATDIRVTFSEPLHSAVLEEQSPIKVPEVIPVLVPGQEWRTFWDFTPRRDASDLPRRYDAEVRFKDARGKQEFDYQFVFDWQALIDRGFIDIRTLHDAARALDEISKTLQRSTTMQGINVLSRDGDAYDTRQREAAERRRQQPDDSPS